MDPRTRALLEAPIAPTLLRLAMPNVVMTLVQASTGLIETYFIGKLGTDALAGVALVFPGVMLMQMMSAGAMGGGVSSAVARALGAGRRDDADAVVLHALVIAAGFAAVLHAWRCWPAGRGSMPRWAAAAPRSTRADLFQHRVRRRHPDLAVQHAGERHPRHRQHAGAGGGDDRRRGAAGAAVGRPDLRLRAAAAAGRRRRRQRAADLLRPRRAGLRRLSVVGPQRGAAEAAGDHAALAAVPRHPAGRHRSPR